MALDLTQLLLEFTQHAAPVAHTESLEDFKQQARGVCRDVQVTPQQLNAVRGQLQALGSSSWQQLASDGVVAADVAKTLNALMRYGSVVQATCAAVVYSWLVRAPSAPVHVLLDTLTLTGCLQRLKECAFAAPSTSKGAKGRAGKASQQQSQAAAAEGDDEFEDADEPSGTQSGRTAAAPAASAADVETALCLCVEVLGNLAVACQQVPLRSNREVLQAALEGCVDLLPCSKGIKAPAGARALGLCTTGTISSAAYGLMAALFSPQHGCMTTMAAAVLPRLTLLIVGSGSPAAGKRTAAEVAADRSAALNFVKEAFRRNPDIQDAVAILARHLCLRAPDKADNRAAAIKAAAELVVELPQWEQEQFVGFVFDLSRTKQLGLRTLSVGLANNLLLNLPEPFKRSTFAAAAASAPGGAAAPAQPAGEADAAFTATPAPTRATEARRKGPNVPAGMVVAPWSVVALATLLQRCSDKSAVVRGRALADLAEVVDCFAALLAQDPFSEQHQVAEAFVEGLGAAAALQLPQASKQPPPRRGKVRRGRAAGDASDGDEASDDAGDDAADAEAAEGMEGSQAGRGAEDEEGLQEDEERAEDGDGDGEVAAAVRRQRALRQSQGAGFVAFMPAQLSADLNPVMSLVHRRCGDSKAAVRRGALQLLEALLVMRASWQVYPRQLPSSADLALLEAATTDPLVSVRKAALVALSTLMELFPAEPSLCTAWVASALPLVRDVEASIQDCLSDWAAALLFDKAAEAAKFKAGGRKGAASSQAHAAGDADTMDLDWQDDTAAGAGSSADGTPAAAVFHELRPLLGAVSNVGSAAGACLGKLCAAMMVKKKLKAGPAARGLEALIAGFPAGSAAALGAWTVLREVAAQDPSAPSWQFLQQRWTAVKQRAAGAHAPGAAAEEAGVTDEAASLLLVISHTTAGFPKEQAEELATELLQHILSFQLPPAAAGAHVTALYRLTEDSGAAGAAGKGPGGPRASGVGSPEAWSKQVYAAVQDSLRRYIDSRSGSAAEPAAGSSSSSSDTAADHSSCVAVFTAGQVALLRAAKPSSNLTLLLQTLTAHKFLPGAAALAASQQYGAPSSQVMLSQYHGPEGQAAAAAGGAVGSSQGLGTQQQQQQIEGTQQPGAAAAAGGTGGRLVPACVQAHAWIALGKVCLVDEGLAKKVVPLFVQELGRSPFPVVRNNIMVALSDMLIQYTALVDAHMPRLAGCIRDRHELVRRQALALLANLLMKDYVKWRGPLFHRFTLAIVDPSPAVRQLAEYLLRDVIAVKAPLLAYNHFVEAIFVLNGCTAGLHGARLGAHMGGAGGGGSAATSLEEGGQERGGGDVMTVAAPAQFTLKGKQHRASRDLIYAALLRSMSPEHKFNSAAKLCGEVLAGVADGLLPLSECEEVLRDALCLMACKEIKVSPSRLAATEDEELPSGSQLAGAASGGSATAAEAAAKARGKLVSALMKRHLVEQVVPVLVELRRLLAEVRHALMAELMGCFAALLKEYKGEVEDILVADKQLAKEILYDIKQAELAKQQHNKAAAQGAPTAAAAGEHQPDEAEPAAAAAAAAGPSGVAGRASPPPAGVLPGTPVAAEVLKTAERQRRLKQQQQQQQQGGAGEMPPPSPRAPAAALQTPGSAAGLKTPATAAGTGSRSRLSHSSLAALKTPASKQTPGTAGALLRTAAKAAGCAAGDAAGAGGVVASPAPLTIGKAGPRSRLKGGAPDENQAPGAAAPGAAGPSRAALLLQRGSSPSAEQPATITLPSPFKPTPQRQWNIPQHVATGEKQQQQQQQQQIEEGEPSGKQQRRGRKAAAPAAVAVKAEPGSEGRQDVEESAAAAGGRSTRGGSSRAAAAAAVKSQQQGKGGRAAGGKAAAAAAAAAAAEDDGSDGDDVAAAGVAAKVAAARSGGARRGTRGQAAASVPAAAAEPAAAGRKRRTKG